MSSRNWFLAVCIIAVVGAGGYLLWSYLQPEEEIADQLVLEASDFSRLDGWSEDSFTGFLDAFGKSCEKIQTLPDSRSMGGQNIAGTAGDWKDVCEQGMALSGEAADIRSFVETRFTPFSVRNNDQPDGLFTGYYEASLKGSRVKSETYNTPLLKRPDDLVMVNLGAFRDSLRGQRIAGFVRDGQLKPYFDRTEIETGALDDRDLEIVYVDSAVDAFFLHIQGSGWVDMEDGNDLRVGYAGQNGHPYYAIGRTLIEQGHVTKEKMSMQAIRDWLETNPDKADELMRLNRSYVFFRELDTGGPIGAQGVELTPERSLAVDRKWMPLGVPIWLETELQENPDTDIVTPFRRLMMAQDTGGAIRGPVRGDVFWGHGQMAYDRAGAMKSGGRYWILLPNSVAERHKAQKIS
ncbi:murein transglycosylase A [Sneathiella chinensis]|uniref:peptidoglycan lytic exotransglycosylase n=1 Tax=Sneathiella chinensis TaxID=349750 RepID=A0ABQ5U0U6_9PROT|nr:MltA domain-containing protein [Sneathiella chinensis]GLQ04929.1 membrane-bound lytic murein transglycosylase A [Sneathiella chinensis]